MAVIMMFGLLPFSVFAEDSNTEASVSDYSTFVSDLAILEQYADQYVREHAGEDAIGLVINYIRCGIEKYTSGTWTTFCGAENTAFTSYVAAQDEQNQTTASELRSLGEFTLPNGNKVDFGHMFGCMDMAYHTGNQSTADLGSWAGDICDLIQLTHNAGVTGTVEEMAEEIRTNNDKYFLYDAPDVHSFGILDLYGDLDAFYILRNLTSKATISSVMKSYFTANLTDAIRASFFLKNRFSGVSSKEDIRSAVYDTYCANAGIKTLEGTYVPDGVNPDLRKACCYAFADYLYETTKDHLNNPYYKVFFSESSILAPGIVQETKMALTQDDKQIVCYLATADITRDDVSVHANYNDNDGSVWKMARVTDQMAAAQAKHSNPDDPEKYVPNYSAVVGINADFYNMSNGAPSGALVMEGVEYNGVGNGNFFGILKDGTPIIGGRAEWDANKENIQEAVGASIWLVKDGKIAVNSNDNYYSDRASRSCVGITYDGRVVMMVLDGRQEPFSAGGNAIEIAHIMLDAGCVMAVNLDGGGSSTFAAKSEGSNDIEIINRPSDGYERSVSSSLLIVSTAKPSNEFDHAVITADYDYLTVGTSLDFKVAGVTSTGGAIALPEDASVKVSDETLGSISADGAVFTASALGDVQIQLVSGDGTVLGAKTLHIVEPTDLKCTKDSINAVYGEATELPLEATYNGNVVKINPNDVQFGYVKITLTSIGTVEGGSVNTTKTELVYEYPEAGSITGFNFTGNADGKLRTVTIGAVLKSKLMEFQMTINQEYARVYAQAKQNGYSDEEAAIQAQTAGINKALELAARITVYLYNSDEAKFDFNTATGGDQLLAWKREVSNSEYKEDQNTYYVLDPEQSAEAAYTFAVDMSKMPIPEKLTSLLYMLPGGDQEGRTAWDFLLQLAERISPLTTVTVTLTIPEGYDVDITNLRLANEYFTMTSAEVSGNTLTIVCNFIEQSEPINPSTANPLCVLSGIKFAPKADAAWDEDNCLSFELSGELNYDIYAHFHILYSLAQQEEYQKEYGLYPYDNRANDPNDYGAHFQNTVTDFSDSFKLNKSSINGWVQQGNLWSYYQNGVALTGIQELQSYDDSEGEKYWYDLGNDGICTGKLTGLFEINDSLYYAVNGTRKAGWRVITDADGNEQYYYFSPMTLEAVDGEQVIATTINDYGKQYTRQLTYTFKNHVLVNGAWFDASHGKRYYWAGEAIARKWRDIEGKSYFFGDHGEALVGFCQVPRGNSGQGADFYLFDEEGALIIRPGLFTLTSDITYIYKDFSVGDIVYFDDNGMAIFAGLVCDANGDYYYINANLKAVRDGLFWVTKTNGLVKPGYQREFDSDGKMIIKNGLYKENGEIYYYENNVKIFAGLVKDDDGNYYYIGSNLKAVKNGAYWVTKTNDLMKSGYQREFDADGKMIVKNGVYPYNGVLVYYVNDDMQFGLGLVELADGSHIYVNEDGTVRYINTLKGLVKEDDGEIYYYENGVKVFAGLVKDDDGNYYYIGSNLKAVKNGAYWVTKTNGLMKSGYQREFDADGKMIVKNGVYPYNGVLVYYVNDDMQFGLGLVELADGSHIYVNEDGTVRYINTQNGLVKEDNGEIYYYENGVKVFAGLVKDDDGNYYYIGSNLKAVKNGAYWVTKTNGLMKSGYQREFDADGKMIVKNGVYPYNGVLVYYVNDDMQFDLGLTQLDDGSLIYVNADATLLANGKRYVSKTNGLLPEGYYTFGADGKMILK